MSFWSSPLGEISGTSEEAFAKSISIIPDGTTARAIISDFDSNSFNGQKYLQIDWLLVDGDYEGQHVFQKIHVFDRDPKKRHRALNMLLLIYKLFNCVPDDDGEPTPRFLAQFKNKKAGIKIQQTEPNEKGKSYNWVSEVHALTPQFVTKTGVKIEKPKESAGYEEYANSVAHDESIPF